MILIKDQKFFVLFALFFILYSLDIHSQSLSTEKKSVKNLLSIQGEIYNATTKRLTRVDQVKLIELSQTMIPVASLANAGPIFSFKGIQFHGKPFLLQAVFEGGNYNKMIVPLQSETEKKHRIVVYSSGAVKQRVKISALLWLTKRKETMQLENIYLIDNQSEPPRSYNLRQENFFVHEKKENLRVTIKNAAVPIPVQLQCPDKENINLCFVDRMIPPGLNELRIQYDITSQQFKDRMITATATTDPYKIVFYKPITAKPKITGAKKVEELDLKVLGKALRVIYPSFANSSAGDVRFDLTEGDYLIENILDNHRNPIFDSPIKTLIGIIIFLLTVLFLVSIIRNR